MKMKNLPPCEDINLTRKVGLWGSKNCSMVFLINFLASFSSMVIKGIVCKKNVAHRRMTARIEKPRFLILGGALEYQRKANSLSSVDTLLQQV